jgi:hypothetical protein
MLETIGRDVRALLDGAEADPGSPQQDAARTAAASLLTTALWNLHRIADALQILAERHD